MNKKGFIEELKSNLKNIPEKELDEILGDYEEHISIGLKNGREEAEIIRSLGDPADIAKQINADYLIKKAENKKSTANIFRAIYASAGMGFLNLLFILPLFIMLLLLLVLLYIIPFVLIMGSHMVLIACAASILVPDFFTEISGFILSPPELIAVFFTNLGFASLGYLILIGAYHITEFLYKHVLRYLKFNLSIIRNKEESI
ncbi:MAG TPA: DUF1700 domain-containing protein [Candidatus Methylomirabilis sp.]|nr:DUF1700 domain-containing protein [Candidatus Methylomirabilis sp.]